MKVFTIQHKHCKAITKIEGYDIWDAMRKNNIKGNAWEIIAEEKI